MYTIYFENGRVCDLYSDLDDSVIVFWLCPLFEIQFFPRGYTPPISLPLKTYNSFGNHFMVNLRLRHDQGAVQLRAVFSDLAPAPWGLPNSGTCPCNFWIEREGCLWIEMLGMMGLCHIKSYYVKRHLNELVVSMKCHVMLCHGMSYHETVKWCDKWILWWMVSWRLSNE